MNSLPRTHALDVVIVALLAMAGGMMSWRTSAAITTAVGGRDGVWFGAEVADTLRRGTADTVEHNRTLHHPLMPSVMRLPLRVARRVAPSLDPMTVVRLTLLPAAGAWVAGIFLICRSFGGGRLDATLFSAVGLTSAALVFWSGVPDIGLFAAVTVLPAIAAASAADRREMPVATWVTVVTASISLDISHGATGLIAAAMHRRWRQTLQITANAITLLIVLCSFQRLIFPSTGRIQDHEATDRPAIRATLLSAPLAPVWPLVLHSMVMPDLVAEPSLSVQQATAWPASITGGTALLSWVVLLLIGLIGAIPPDAARIRRFLLLALGAQLLLQLILAGETFHGAPGTVPLLLALAALGTLGPWRRTVIALAVVLLVSAAVNNTHQFQRSLDVAAPNELVPQP